MAVTTAVAVGTAAVGAVSARKGAKAAEKAGEAQSEAALTSVAEQRRQFDITQQQFAPFRQAGLGALQQQLALLGLPGLDPTQFGPQAGAGQATLGPGGQPSFRQVRGVGRVPRFVQDPGEPGAPGAPFPEQIAEHVRHPALV